MAEQPRCINPTSLGRGQTVLHTPRGGRTTNTEEKHIRFAVRAKVDREGITDRASRHADLLNKLAYGELLRTFYRPYQIASLERWLAAKCPMANAVNIREAIDLAVERFEQRVLNGSEYYVRLLRTDFPFFQAKRVIARLARGELRKLSRSRRVFRSRVPAPLRLSNVRAPRSWNGRYGYSRYPLDLTDDQELLGIFDRSTERTADPTFHLANSMQQASKFSELMHGWKNHDPEMYLMCQGWLAWSASGKSGSCFAHVARMLGCSESAARGRWRRRLRMLNAPDQLALNDLVSGLHVEVDCFAGELLSNAESAECE
jgi:hypothetical protein